MGKNTRSVSNKQGDKVLPLKGSMKLKTVVQNSTTEYSFLNWFVKDYHVLDYGILYFQMFESKELKCVFKLIKTELKLKVALRLCYTNADAMFYMDNNHRISKMAPANEISKGLYVAEFPHHLVLHKEGYCMEKGILKLAFRFIIGCTAERQDNPYGVIGGMCDVDSLSSDIKFLYLLSFDPDFTLNVAEVSLSVHKCILSARSKFFEEYFRKYEQVEEFPVPSTTPGIMHEVLVYLYSGELSKMNTECMINVFELAYLLKISSLKEKCSRYFEENGSWRDLSGMSFWEYEIE